MSKIKGYELEIGETQNPLPRKKAVALLYNKHRAPVVSAKGEGGLANEIIELASEHGIYVAQDPILADLLSKLEIDQEIPEDLYHSVAIILSWAFWLHGKAPP